MILYIYGPWRNGGIKIVKESGSPSFQNCWEQWCYLLRAGLYCCSFSGKANACAIQAPGLRKGQLCERTLFYVYISGSSTSQRNCSNLLLWAYSSLPQEGWGVKVLKHQPIACMQSFGLDCPVPISISLILSLSPRQWLSEYSTCCSLEEASLLVGYELACYLSLSLNAPLFFCYGWMVKSKLIFNALLILISSGVTV